MIQRVIHFPAKLKLISSLNSPVFGYGRIGRVDTRALKKVLSGVTKGPRLVSSERQRIEIMCQPVALIAFMSFYGLPGNLIAAIAVLLCLGIVISISAANAERVSRLERYDTTDLPSP
jgi:hypothetical protein